MNETQTSNILSFSLCEIAGWFGGKHETGKPTVEIPAFQRGLVWNAAQIEVLWDSLMRNIPIGAFSLLPMKGNEQYSKAKDGEVTTGAENRYFLLDGQQRANAIALAFQTFPCGEQEKTSSILWMDLCPDETLTKRSNRKFFFYVTTPARPWGYRIEDANEENRAGKVSVGQYQVALGEAGLKENSAQKPSPAKLWPVCAGLPVPVAVLWNHPASESEIAAVGGDAPWVRHFVSCAESLPQGKVADSLRAIGEKLDAVLARTRIMAMVAPDGLANEPPDGAETGDNSEIALYFTRLNRGGTTPSREDLDYSILKSILPELHQIDDCAKERMHPARLAHLAMLAFLSAESENGWKSGLSRREIFGLKVKPPFSSFIAEELKRDIEIVDGWLLFKEGTVGHGLPPFLRTRLAQRHPNLYRFLLMLAGRMRGRTTTDGKFSRLMVAFCTTLAWFGDDGTLDFGELAKRMEEITDSAESIGAVRRILGEWMAAQIGKRSLQVPPTPTYFEKIKEAVKTRDMAAIRMAWSDPAQTGANKIWYWNHEEGRGLVLYACRKYLAQTFGTYDPALAAWNEDSRPWDYDHIVPQAWLKGTHHGTWHELVWEFLNSIGNIAPIPFGANRSKHDIPPGKVDLYGNGASDKSLFLDFDIEGRTPEFIDKYLILEDAGDAALDFARVTARRMAALYGEWWNTLKIGELLADCRQESRKAEVEAFAAELRAHFPEDSNRIRTVFWTDDGTQKDVVEPWDWARPWIACGIEGWFRGKEATNPVRCFLAQTFQSGKHEFGFRRHPDENTLDHKNEWWIVGHYFREGDFFNYATPFIHGTPDSEEWFGKEADLEK